MSDGISKESTEETPEDYTALAVVAKFLIDENWLCEQVVDQPILHTMFASESGERWHCFANLRPANAQLLFYSVAPLRVSPVMRPAVAEFLTRANWGLLLGNFEMDYNDGEVRYKTCLQFEETPLTPALVRPVIIGNVAGMDRYLPGLKAIIAQEKTPLEAIQSVEGT